LEKENMKQILFIVTEPVASKGSAVNTTMQDKQYLARRVATECKQSNVAVEILCESAFLLPLSSGLQFLKIALPATKDHGFQSQCLVVEDSDWMK